MIDVQQRKGLQEEIPTCFSAASIFVGTKWKKQEAGNNRQKQANKASVCVSV